jgi:periplasmic divalent cation tolerance protein
LNVERGKGMTDPYCVILSTAGSQEEADRLAELLVTRRLAACVQMIPITSRYLWKGEMNKDAEVLLLVKTASHLYPEVEAAIVQNHSYEVPEILQLPVAQGLERYLGWISDNTKQG